mmetsp:Transcript_97093/g.274442  ORF Transcript_97093/g.274442 Transcript_97093/m.274442 type:complete len:236 (-) Transcript_97093:922-1629(-)
MPRGRCRRRVADWCAVHAGVAGTPLRQRACNAPHSTAAQGRGIGGEPSLPQLAGVEATIGLAQARELPDAGAPLRSQLARRRGASAVLGEEGRPQLQRLWGQQGPDLAIPARGLRVGAGAQEGPPSGAMEVLGHRLRRLKPGRRYEDPRGVAGLARGERGGSHVHARRERNGQHFELLVWPLAPRAAGAFRQGHGAHSVRVVALRLGVHARRQQPAGRARPNGGSVGAGRADRRR